MPSNVGNKKFNGGTEPQRAEKWRERNRRHNSTDAGQGNRASRNQGTGQLGRDQRNPETTIDTTNMTQADKLRYFQQLGLIPDGEHKPKPPAQPEVKDSVVSQSTYDVNKANQDDNAFSPSKNFSANMQDVFKDHPDLARKLINTINEIDPVKQKRAKAAAFRELQDLQGEDPKVIYDSVLGTLMDFY